MADTTYIVQIKMETEGGLDVGKTGLASAAMSANTMAERLRTAGEAVRQLGTLGTDVLGKFTGALEWAASKAWEVGSAIGKLAIGAGVAAVTYGVVKLNEELETTRISLGAIFAAEGQAGNLNAGLELASDTIVKMRRDAGDLPGEFEDLLNIMTTTAIPAFQAGMDVEGLRELSSKLMATGVVASMPLDMVAREAAQLMSGRAGGHNVLGMRLMGLHGEAAKQFNKLTAAERLEKINTELEKYKGAIAEFGRGFEATSSTVVDNAKEWLRMLTQPLFEGITMDLAGINEWFGQNEALLASWAQYIGQKLVEAWEWGKKKILEWWPLIRDFASVAWDRLTKVWKDIEPSVVRIGDALKEALKDPNGTIDKLITLAKIWATAKGAEVAIGGATGLLGTALTSGASILQLGFTAQTMGLMGGGAAGAGGAGAAAGGGLLGAGGLAALGSAAAVAGAALAAVGAVAWAGYEAYKLHEEIVEQDRIHLMKMGWEAEDFVEKAASMGDATGMTTSVIEQLTAAGHEAEAELYRVALEAHHAAVSLASIAERETERQQEQIIMPAVTAIGQMALQQMGEQQTAAAQAAEEKRKKTRHPGGAGGTNIQKVEIVVTSNQDPSRIARAVTDELAKAARLRKSSPHVTNYAALGQRGGNLG
jgi:hypothetical protein